MATTGKKTAKTVAKAAAPAKQTGAEAALEAFREAVRALEQAGEGLAQAGRRSKTFGMRKDVAEALQAAQKAVRKIKTNVVAVPPTTTVTP